MTSQLYRELARFAKVPWHRFFQSSRVKGQEMTAEEFWDDNIADFLSLAGVTDAQGKRIDWANLFTTILMNREQLFTQEELNGTSGSDHEHPNQQTADDKPCTSEESPQQETSPPS